MTRRTLLIVIISFLVLGIAGVLIFRALTPPAPTGTQQRSIFGRLPIIGGRGGPESPGDQIPTPPSERMEAAPSPEARRLTQITDEAVTGVAVDPKTQKLLYYRKKDGHLLANSQTGGNEEAVSNLTILNIIRVAWSPARNRALVLYQDGEEIKQFISEATSTPKVAFLPKDASSPAWAPDGKAIFWASNLGGVSTLVSADPDGKNQRRRAFTTPIPDVLPLLITPDLVGIIPKTVSFFETPLLLFNLKTSQENILLSQFGLRVVGDMHPTSQLLAYSSTNRVGALNDLHTLDINKNADTAWTVKTLADKCAFSKDATLLFCAVPKNNAGRDLPEAWFQGKISFADSFVRLNLATNKAEEIFNEGEYDAADLVVADDNKRLFFTDKKTGFLYALSLE